MKQKRALNSPVKHASRTSASKHVVHKVTSARHKQKQAIKQKIRQARPLHKRFLLHPATAMMLLVAGVLIVGWTYKVTADSYSVTAKVPAAPLADSAVITSPADGDIFTVSPITVSGTCPSNSYVTLTRNGLFSGVAGCAADDNTFSIDTSLSAGTNTLLAQDYNVTDDPGPATPGITVTYLPPAPTPSSNPTTTTTSSPSSSPSTAPLLLSSAYQFRAFIVGASFSWSLKLDGGLSPYSIRVDWGDKKTSTQKQDTPSGFTITHRYNQAGYFPVKVYATDAAGLTTMLQIAAFVRAPGVSGFLIQNQGTPTSFWSNVLSVFGNSKWLLLAWPSYITVTLMAASFWLGEQQILQRALASRNTLRIIHNVHRH